MLSTADSQPRAQPVKKRLILLRHLPFWLPRQGICNAIRGSKSHLTDPSTTASSPSTATALAAVWTASTDTSKQTPKPQVATSTLSSRS